MGLYYFNKNRQKIVLVYIVLAIISSAYIMYQYNDTKQNCINLAKKQLIIKYEMYKKIYLYYGSAKDILIENPDFIDNSEFINEMSKSTPFFTHEMYKDIVKYDLTFKYFSSDNCCYGAQEFVNALGNNEYNIQIKNKVSQLFGKVGKNGFVLITKQNKNQDRQDKLLFFFVSIVVFIFVNIFLFFYFIIMNKAIHEEKTFMEKEYEYLKEDTQKLAFEDKLTGASSRLKFDDTLKDYLVLSNRFEEQKFCFILFDIDNFKYVNDSFGHDYGDLVLQKVSYEVKEYIRECDFFARWGGEEFVILLPLTDLDHGLIVCEKIRQHISQIKFEKLDSVTCSFGLTQFQTGDDEKSLLKRVDLLLYEAKKSGKNKVIIG